MGPTQPHSRAVPKTTSRLPRPFPLRPLLGLLICQVEPSTLHHRLDLLDAPRLEKVIRLHTLPRRLGRIQQLLGVGLITIVLIVRHRTDSWQWHICAHIRHTKGSRLVSDVPPTGLQGAPEIWIGHLLLDTGITFDALLSPPCPQVLQSGLSICMFCGQAVQPCPCLLGLAQQVVVEVLEVSHRLLHDSRSCCPLWIGCCPTHSLLHTIAHTQFVYPPKFELLWVLPC